LLDCEELDEATLNAIEGQLDIFYEEPDLSRRRRRGLLHTLWSILRQVIRVKEY
jgi:hypothetical protein